MKLFVVIIMHNIVVVLAGLQPTDSLSVYRITGVLLLSREIAVNEALPCDRKFRFGTAFQSGFNILFLEYFQITRPKTFFETFKITRYLRRFYLRRPLASTDTYIMIIFSIIKVKSKKNLSFMTTQLSIFQQFLLSIIQNLFDHVTFFVKLRLALRSRIHWTMLHPSRDLSLFKIRCNC